MLAQTHRLPIIMAVLVIGSAALLIVQSQLHLNEKAALQTQLEELRAVRRTQQEEQARMARLLSEAEARLAQQSEQQGDLSLVVDELRDRLQALNGEYRALLQTFEANQQRLTNANERLQTLMDAESQREQQAAQLAVLSTQINELEVENAGLRSTLSDYRSLAQNAHTNLLTERSQRQQLETALQQEQAALEQLQSRLENLDSEQENLIEQLSDGSTVIKLPERILFEAGSATLNDQAQAVLSEIATAIASFPEYTIAVQGHSDSVPVVANVRQFPSNWELSSARASAAVRVLADQGIDPARLKATGFADTRPLVEETDDVSRRENRRIEVVLEPPLNIMEFDEDSARAN
ncbi:MAG: OmpA/MotB family protein [Saccharospirillum sp.]